MCLHGMFKGSEPGNPNQAGRPGAGAGTHDTLCPSAANMIDVTIAKRSLLCLNSVKAGY